MFVLIFGIVKIFQIFWLWIRNRRRILNFFRYLDVLVIINQSLKFSGIQLGDAWLLVLVGHTCVLLFILWKECFVVLKVVLLCVVRLQFNNLLLFYLLRSRGVPLFHWSLVNIVNDNVLASLLRGLLLPRTGLNIYVFLVS